jgi:hypothetical protein
MFASLNDIAAVTSGATPSRTVEIPVQQAQAPQLPARANPETAPVPVEKPGLLQRVPWWVWVGGTVAIAGGVYWYFLREKPEEDEVRENPGPKSSWRDVADALHAAASAKSLVS